MKTSNFAKCAGNPTAVSISQGVPKWFRGRQYKKLAPSWAMVRLKDEAEYVRQYKALLAKLDPREVVMELGMDAILLCWEKPGEFCHRRLVAEWLQEHLNIEVPEVGFTGTTKAPKKAPFEPKDEVQLRLM